MIEPEPPDDEDARLRALERYEILDTLPEQVYDDLVALAAHIMGTPIALVSLVDADRQWFKARLGLDAPQTPRSVSFCGHAVEASSRLVVSDARLDERFHDNPLVTSEPNVIFYAGAPITSPEGHTLGTLCVIDHEPRDVTEHALQMLDALAREVASQLELRYRLRRGEELTRELEAAREEAVRADRAKSTFLATMSHELRTPLNSILGFTRVLLKNPRDALNDRELDYLDRIQRNGMHLLTLIQGVLDIAKIESETTELELEPIDPVAIVRDVAASLEGLASATKTALSVDAPADVDHVTADPAATTQVLVNLIGNALEFAAGGRVQVRVVTAGSSAPLRVDVVDDGPGIPEDALDAVFEAFHQVDGSTARSHPGSGLGLAIARRLCEAQGFSLQVVSEVGRGSIFWIALAPDAPPPEL